MAVLVGEDAQAAVLGLHGVVAEPDTGRVVRDQGLDRPPPLLPTLTPTRPPAHPPGARYQRWLQMASVPWCGSPAASSPPAWTIWMWSM